MMRGRSGVTSFRERLNVWPGFTDIMVALLLLFVFVVTLFTITETILSRSLSQKDTELERLHREISLKSDEVERLKSEVGRLAELFGAGFAHYAPPIRTPTARLISDRALRSVHLPVQVLLAGNTVHDSATGVHRIWSVVPGWQYRLWPYNSHALPIERASEINDSIRCFVSENPV